MNKRFRIRLPRRTGRDLPGPRAGRFTRRRAADGIHRVGEGELHAGAEEARLEPRVRHHGRDQRHARLVVPNAITPLSGTDVTQPGPSGDGVPPTAIRVEIFGSVSPDLINAIQAANGVVNYTSTRWNAITATLPVAAIVPLAARSDITAIRNPALGHTNVGSVTSQGYVAHAANTVVAGGFNGSGVKVGVLSDSATPARVAALIASGDLPPGTTSLPGQDGSDVGGEDEGTAMMEIVHDMAPGASLLFATAFESETSFADNIIALANAGCKVIVDDVSYFDEGAFQDGIVAQAVNQVTAMGVTYFSAAANSGNVTRNTSGTWEGDFNSGGAVTGVINTQTGETGLFHNFSSTGTQNYDVLTTATTYITLKWSDPLGASTNDYDLFVLNSTGTSILAFSASAQDGTEDPFEIAYRSNGSAFPVNSRIVIVKYTGATRAMHLDTNRGTVSIGTSGSTYGHNAGLNTMSMAATNWNSAKTGTRPFTGFANPNETFSSDGPRKIFYKPDGTPITPGNFLFSTNGGQTLQKPDVAAADGVTTHTPGFLPFFGTSAAAPHGAGIAALILSAGRTTRRTRSRRRCAPPRSTAWNRASIATRASASRWRTRPSSTRSRIDRKTIHAVKAIRGGPQTGGPPTTNPRETRS